MNRDEPGPQGTGSQVHTSAEGSLERKRGLKGKEEEGHSKGRGRLEPKYGDDRGVTGPVRWYQDHSDVFFFEDIVIIQNEKGLALCRGPNFFDSEKNSNPRI